MYVHFDEDLKSESRASPSYVYALRPLPPSAVWSWKGLQVGDSVVTFSGAAYFTSCVCLSRTVEDPSPPRRRKCEYAASCCRGSFLQLRLVAGWLALAFILFGETTYPSVVHHSATWTWISCTISPRPEEEEVWWWLRRPVPRFRSFDDEERKFPFSAINLFHSSSLLGALTGPWHWICFFFASFRPLLDAFSPKNSYTTIIRRRSSGTLSSSKSAARRRRVLPSSAAGGGGAAHREGALSSIFWP
ncbi:hypothetical protein C8R45DRAFT_87324 [Mycena sanguinolenta]|nr:hypothetical protein C8R45DRAFT_87324 [Mycena sanguinolenta]